MKLSCLWISLLGLCFASAEAVNYYVSVSGNDGNTGTYAKPFRTITKGAGLARAGDTVFVMSGTYDETFRMTQSGTQGKPIVLINYPGHSPKIVTSRCAQNIIHLASTVSYTAPIGWIVIEGFEITATCPQKKAVFGIRLANGHDIVIRRNYIHHTGDGMLGHGTRITIDRNVISDNGQFAECAADPTTCNKDHGLYLSGTYYTVTNNIIRDNLAYGLQIAGYPYNSTSHAGPEYAGARFWLVANNTFAFNQYRPGIGLWQPGASDNRFENNIFYENSERESGPQGIDFYDCGCNQTVKNNLFYATAPGGTGTVSETPNTKNTCGGKSSYIETGSINANPGFKAPASHDFHLTSSSPAINKGADLLSQGVTRDLDGIVRPQGPAFDIGAYEYPIGSGFESRSASSNVGSAFAIRSLSLGGISIIPSSSAKTRAVVYSLSGRQLASFDNITTEGATWSAGKSSAGVYLVRVQSGNDVQTTKVYCGK